jgi:hypothetical protein
MSIAPTPAQVRAQVAAVLEKATDARVIGVRAPLGMALGDTLRLDGRELRVSRTDSVLALREQLDALPEGAPPLVLLTTLDESELGADLLARLARRRLFSVDPWQLVKERFRARWVAPELVERHAWVARALLEVEPPEGFPPAPSGFLQEELVWRILFDALLGLCTDEHDAEAWIEWSLAPENTCRAAALTPEQRTSFAAALEAGAGSVARTVFACATGPHGADTFAVGLASRVLFTDAVRGESAAAKATGKLEALLGSAELDAKTALLWADAAESVAERLLRQRPWAEASGLLERGDALLTSLGAESFAQHSRYLSLGLRQRLAALAATLHGVVAGKASAAADLEGAVSRVLAHVLVRYAPARRQGIDMSARLARWLASRQGSKPKPPGSLAEAAGAYRREGGFLDWARSVLWDADPLPALGKAYGELRQAVTTLRETQNRCFGELLSGWVKTGSHLPAVIRVEHVLDRLVAPLAAAHPVLLVVLDGMGMAVFRELEADLLRQGWIELDAPDASRRLPVIAALPTLTEVSRTSLLCGKLCVGNADTERAGFSSHAGLVGAGLPARPPVLFHKGDLISGSGGIASMVSDAIGDDKRKVVGVVINAVDDHLAKGDQIRVDWTTRRIRPLEELLAAARDAGRAVVLTSDHGHVPEHGTAGRAGGPGERWRDASDAPADDEVRLAGQRVLLGDQHGVVAPWSERVRYGSKKNGYHGGATPQEVVIPLGVFVHASISVPGWDEVASELPHWWTAEASAAPPAGKRRGRAATARTAAPPLRLKPKPATKPGGQGELFTLDDSVQPETEAETEAAVTAAAASDWIDRLLASDTLAAQRKSAARVALTDQRLRAVLAALEERGGKLSRPALATRIGVPELRISGVISAARRVLNVDGYPILSVDEASDTVELNRRQLLQQFGLEP